MRFTLLFLLASSCFAASQTDLIGFRGRKGWTGLASIEYQMPAPSIINIVSADYIPEIVNISFTSWRPDGSIASGGRVVNNHESWYGYLMLNYDTEHKEITWLDIGTSGGGWEPSSGLPYSPAAYLYVHKNYGKWRGVLLDDNTGPEYPGWKLDEGRVFVGGIPTHAPDSIPTAAILAASLAALALYRPKREPSELR